MINEVIDQSIKWKKQAALMPPPKKVSLFKWNFKLFG